MLKFSTRSLLKAAAMISLQHHERYDGTGYPEGLRGESIHIYARITTVADVYDALSNDRIYRKAMGENEVLQYLNENSGGLFDPDIVKVFLENWDSIQVIRRRFNQKAGYYEEKR